MVGDQSDARGRYNNCRTLYTMELANYMQLSNLFHCLHLSPIGTIKRYDISFRNRKQTLGWLHHNNLINVGWKATLLQLFLLTDWIYNILYIVEMFA